MKNLVPFLKNLIDSAENDRPVNGNQLRGVLKDVIEMQQEIQRLKHPQVEVPSVTAPRHLVVADAVAARHLVAHKGVLWPRVVHPRIVADPRCRHCGRQLDRKTDGGLLLDGFVCPGHRFYTVELRPSEVAGTVAEYNQSQPEASG